MPPPKAHPSQQKKKKGHAPAHQNSFAFHHNPGSKKTAAILALPIQYVCRRCHEKLEWRKQYRKYKPRTVPGKCNHCQQKTVRAAYHTICEKCTMSSTQSKELLNRWNTTPRLMDERITNGDDHEDDEDDDNAVDDEICEAYSEEDRQEQVNKQDSPLLQVEPTFYRRVCAMCVKEPALPGSDDEGGDDNAVHAPARRLRLREIKTLERQRQAAARLRRRKNASAIGEGDEHDGEDNSKGESAADDSLSNGGSDEDDEEDEDPLLRAVGGSEKLLTGEAYQQMLLRTEKKAVNTTREQADQDISISP